MNRDVESTDPPPAKRPTMQLSDSEEDVLNETPEIVAPPNEAAKGAVSDFAIITGTDENIARTILQDVNWNLDAALDIFFAREENAPKKRTSEPSSSAKTTNDEEAEGPVDLQGLELSLVTWNIDGLDGNSLSTRTKAVYKILKDLNPDFVFLQEVVNREIATIQALEKFYKIYYSNTESHYFTAILVSKQFDVINEEVIHFANSGMMRTLQIIEGSLGGMQKVFLLNTHLESTKDHSRERKEQFAQCMAKIKELIERHPNCLLFFGGDLNIRDNEVSDVPAGVADAWIAAGSNKKEQYTFDMSKNDNKQGLFNARCRFDRIYWYGSLRRVAFSLQGKQRIRSCLAFPSDHWAVHCKFT